MKPQVSSLLKAYCLWMAIILSGLSFTGCENPNDDDRKEPTDTLATSYQLSLSKAKVCLGDGSSKKCFPSHKSLLGLHFNGENLKLVNFAQLDRIPSISALQAGKFQARLTNEKKIPRGKTIRIASKAAKYKQDFPLTSGQTLFLRSDYSLDNTPIYSIISPSESAGIWIEGATVSVEDIDCGPDSGFVQGVLYAAPGSETEINGCLWREDGNLGTIVVMDIHSDPLPPSILVPAPLDLEASILEEETAVLSSLAPVHLAALQQSAPPCNRLCDYSRPDFLQEDNWDFICSWPAADVSFSVDSDAKLNIHVNWWTVAVIDHTEVKVGFQIIESAGSEPMISFYFDGSPAMVESSSQNCQP